LEELIMKKTVALTALAAAAIGFIAGYALKPSPHSSASPQSENFSLVPAALAQEKKPEVMPFNYNSPREPALAPDAPHTMYWSVDDLRKAHSDLAEVAAKAMKEAGTGSSQSFGGGPVRVSSRNFSIFQLYRLHREQPVPSLTKVNSVWDDAEQHAGAYDFYVITGGTGEMIVGGKIANRQNLMDKDGPVPGEYRGQPIIGGQTFKVKAGDCLLIPPDQPHQPKPDAGGFSYVIMKINVGVYPWSLIR
jgi:mannose-6-phosphate isomerase-like protein (cupin superfamily)